MSIRTEQAEAWWANHCADLYDDSVETQLSQFIQEIEAELWLQQQQQAMIEDHEYQACVAADTANFDPADYYPVGYQLHLNH